jgi:hypothetical protein
VAVHEADPEENSDPREIANIAKSALDARDQRTQQGPITSGSPISRGQKSCYLQPPPARNAGFKRQILRENGVKELLVERTPISIRRHVTATLTRLENK